MTDIRVAAIIIEDDKILTTQMERDGDRYYVLPGGKVESGENIEEALKRELMEETSIQLENFSLAYLRELRLDDGERGIEFYYYVDEYSGEPETGYDPEDKQAELKKVEKLEVSKLDDEKFFPEQLIEKLQEDERSEFQQVTHLGLHEIEK